MNMLLIALYYPDYTSDIAEERRAVGHQVKNVQHHAAHTEFIAT